MNEIEKLTELLKDAIDLLIESQEKSYSIIIEQAKDKLYEALDLTEEI